MTQFILHTLQVIKQTFKMFIYKQILVVKKEIIKIDYLLKWPTGRFSNHFLSDLGLIADLAKKIA